MAEVRGLSEYEQRLRAAVRSRLRKKLGSDWMSSTVPPAMAARWKAFADQRLDASTDPDGLIEFSSLGDLFSLLERHWALLADLVGGDRTEFGIFRKRLKAVRDEEGHSRPVAESEKALAEAICAQLTASLRGAVGPRSQIVLDSAHKNFNDPTLGYGASRDLLDELWEERDKLDLSCEHIAFLLQSEDMNDGQYPQRWLDLHGLGTPTMLRLLADNAIRLSWMVQRRRALANIVGVPQAIRWALENAGATSTLSVILDALRLLPDVILGCDQDGGLILGSTILQHSIARLTESAYIGCCQRYCARVSGYADAPDEMGRRLVIQDTNKPCHVGRLTPHREVEINWECRLDSVPTLRGGSGDTLDQTLDKLKEALTILEDVFSAHAHSTKPADLRGIPAIWVDRPRLKLQLMPPANQETTEV